LRAVAPFVVAADAAAKDAAAGRDNASPTTTPHDMGVVKSPRDSTPRSASISRRAS
jgi:hypothetical protein